MHKACLLGGFRSVLLGAALSRVSPGGRKAGGLGEDMGSRLPCRRGWGFETPPALTLCHLPCVLNLHKEAGEQLLLVHHISISSATTPRLLQGLENTVVDCRAGNVVTPLMQGLMVN